MLEATKLAQVAAEFRRYKLEILGLSETRWKESGEKRLSTGETFLYSGKPQDAEHRSGVGLMLSKSARQCLKSWSPISDRILIARFESRIRHITYVQVYAPTEQASVEDKEAFYEQLAHTFERINKSDIVVLMGDLNAKVGSSNANWENVMGTHGLGAMNSNGELFADFCGKYNLIIGGTIFPHKNVHKATWVSPDRTTQNQIDHIAISKRWRTSLLDVRARRGADVYSDHHLVVGQLRIKLKANNKRQPTCAKKLNVAKLKNEDNAQVFVNTINDTLAAARTTNNLSWVLVKEAYQQAGKDILGFINYERKEWISDTTWNLIMERRNTKQLINASSDAVQRANLQRIYNIDNKKARSSARADKRRWTNNIAAEAQKAADSRNARETYRLARKLINKPFMSDRPLCASDGTLATTEDHQTNIWTQYFTELLNKPPNDVPRSPVENINRAIRYNVGPPNQQEIKAAIKHLKNGKAPGADNISPEMFKADINLSSSVLLEIVGEVWETEDIPDEWNESLIIKLPKKGDLKFCKNWRGISLLNTINKIISIIVHNRLASALDPVLRKEQAGFRPGRSCIDHINTLRVIAEQSIEWQSPLYMLFVDFKQAFDSVDRNMLWTILASYGIPAKMTNLIKQLYRNATCKVVHRGKLGSPFMIRSGVKQGCILSPLLFLLTLDWVMKKVNAVPHGIRWNLTERLGDLDFADDICLLTHSKTELESLLTRLVKYSSQAGLQINVAKTKLIRLNTNTVCNLSLQGESIEEVDSFCYLGSYITGDGGADADVASRIQKARQAFYMLNKVWNASNLSRNLKLKIFKTNCLAVLLYGCETWKVTSSIESKIQVFVNKCLKRILKIYWPRVISNENLWALTGFEKMDLVIRRRKWNWIGHTLRKPVDDIARQSLDWNPQGIRKRGRPKTTWKRTVVEEAKAGGKEWREVTALAKNRTRWKAFVDALCSLDAE